MDKGKKVKIINKLNSEMPFSLGDVIGLQRGATIIKTICGCNLLVNSEYLKEKIDNHQAIRHYH